MPDYYEVSLSMTRRCNAVCAHCCVDAGPDAVGELSREQVRRLIKSAVEYGVKFIAYTGGEVTLRYGVLMETLEYAQSLGVYNIVVTNGHWGRTAKQAREVAVDLKQRGTVEVQLSGDQFHAPYVPFGAVLRAAEAIRACGLRALVMLARLKGDRETEEFKEELLLRDFEVVEQPVMPFSGRSRQIRAELLQRFSVEDIERTGCISVLSPTVGPDGKLFACCASDFTASEGSPLVLGDTRRRSFSELLEAHRDSPLLDAIYLWGPAFLYRLLLDVAPSTIRDVHFPLFGYCDLCYQLLTNREAVAELRRALTKQDLLRRIAIGKVVKRERIRRSGVQAPDWYECVIEREEVD